MRNRKVRKGIPKNRWKIKDWKETKSNQVVFGDYGLKALEFGRITAKQIEAARKAIRRHFKKTHGNLWIRIYPSIPVTKKPAEVRMGKGKGAIDHWVCFVKPGRILFEVQARSMNSANIKILDSFMRSILKAGSIKLPIATTIVTPRIS